MVMESTSLGQASCSNRLAFKGAALFRAKVVGSLLTTKPLVMSAIRELDEAPGLREYEISFLRLVEKLTNGTNVHINVTGTKLNMEPGVITGGSGIEHDCTFTGRGVGFYIAGILPICLFSKRSVQITFHGVTSSTTDICVESLAAATFPLLKHFGLQVLPEIKIVKRGCIPNGKGTVEFFCPVARKLSPIQLLDPGYVKRIRGIAHAVKVSPQFSNRMVDSIRGVFNKFLPDVYINTDHVKGNQASLTEPGFGVMLSAESTTGCVHTCNRIAEKDDEVNESHAGVAKSLSPEDIGQKAAEQLCEEIVRGGCVDSSNQALVLLLMVLTSEDVSKVRFGNLTDYTIQNLRLMHTLYGVKFKIAVEHSSIFETDEHLPLGKEEYASVVLSCRGIGFSNISRRVT